ncbi:MAG: hypothetical protein ACI86M_003625 [Saprospiraceae bacterium]|jgi:hypothetical protein
MKTKFYHIYVDNSIMDVYSVKVAHNRKAIKEANWNEWYDKNLLNNFYTFEPTDLSTPRLKYDPDTPLTDIIEVEDFPDRGCIVSAKLLKILNGFCLPNIKIFPMEISYKNEIHMYHYILFIHDSTIDIDYEKTTFDLRKDGIIIPDTHISYDEWANAFKNKNRYMPSGKSSTSYVYFKEHNFDFFTLDRIFSKSIIVTEKLKIVLEKELFGIVFDECKNYHN